MTAMTSPFQTLAIVVGGGLNALGIVRSLGRRGVPLVVLDSNPMAPAMRSRHGRKQLVASLEGEPLVAALLALAAGSAAPPVLFLTEEKSVATVSLERQRVQAACRICLPEHARLMQLMEKPGFSELAEQYRAPVPRTVRIQRQQDLALLDGLRFPCIFKPAYKDYGYGERFQKAYKVASAQETAELFARIEPVLPDMVAQEWIEGEDGDIYFCLQYIGADGRLVASFSGRKIRSWPPRVGGTASCTAAWECHGELSATTARFFAQVGFTGMGSMEYKRDSRDGKFYMVEPTVGRTDYQEEVATLNGVNIPLAAYCHEAGLPLPTPPLAGKPEQARTVIWRDPQADKWSRQAGDGRADARSAGQRVADAYWRWQDPRPWLDFMRERVGARLRRQG